MRKICYYYIQEEYKMKLNALKDVQHYAFTLAEVLITLGIIELQH